MLQLLIKNFNNEYLNILRNFFQLKRMNGQVYIVTVHNYLPILDNIFLEENKLKMCINSNWNELLILKSDKLISDVPLINFSDISLKFLPVESKIKINNIIGTICDYSYYTYGNLPNYPNIVYIKIKINIDGLLLGSPVYNLDNKLIGIVSFACDYVYCLPVYYLIRTFKKDNNISVPNIPLKIDKINKYIVRDIYVYNPVIGYKIPVDCHLLLEPDSKIYVKNNGNYDKINVPYLRYNERNFIKNNKKIKLVNKKYEISISSLYLLRQINSDLALELYNFINNNDKFNDYTFKIVRGHLRFFN